MAQNGWQEITSGLQTSQEFDFQGGYMAYAVIGVNSGHDYEMETELGGVFYKFDLDVTPKFLDVNLTPVRRSLFPAGRYRISCTQTAGLAAVKMWWANCPTTLIDSLL